MSNQENVIFDAMQWAGFNYDKERSDASNALCFTVKPGVWIKFAGLNELVYWAEKYIDSDEFFEILNNENVDSYQIYQLDNSLDDFPVLFVRSYDDLQKRFGLTPDITKYKCEYYDELTTNDKNKNDCEILERLFEIFNIHLPADFKGHSMSVSDVVVLERNGAKKAYYCDMFGWKEIENFCE